MQRRVLLGVAAGLAVFAGLELGAQEPGVAPGGAQESAEQLVERGKSIYQARCKGCHGSDGKGTMEELDLTDRVWRHGSTPDAIEKVIREGVKGTGMRPIAPDTTDADLKALVRYVLAFSAGIAAPPAPNPAVPATPPAAPSAPAPPAPPPPA